MSGACRRKYRHSTLQTVKHHVCEWVTFMLKGTTQPPDSCSQPGAPKASPRFSATFIGCRVPERIQFRLCVLAFRCPNASAPPYLAESVCRTADVEGRRHLCSSTTMTLVVPSVQRSTLGDRAFPVAASRAWNSLPPAI